MHPTIGCYHQGQDHLADLRHQPQRHALTRAARCTRLQQSRHPGLPLPALARRAHAVLGPGSQSSVPAHGRHVLARHQAQPCGHFGSPSR